MKQKGAVQFKDLYHFTSPENASAIMAGRSMKSVYSDRAAYFTTHPDSEYGSGFGTAKVHVKVPEHLAELDDEFPSGEQHYRVPVGRLRPEHFQEGS
jgi:hypothetical protein